MPASKTTMEVINMDPTIAVAVLAGASGLAAFTKKLGLWPKFTPVEKTEIEMLDADMPDGWWRRVKDHVNGNTMTKPKVSWRHGERHGAATGYTVGQADDGSLLVTTPILDEETNTLV